MVVGREGERRPRTLFSMNEGESVCAPEPRHCVADRSQLERQVREGEGRREGETSCQPASCFGRTAIDLPFFSSIFHAIRDRTVMRVCLVDRGQESKFICCLAARFGKKKR